MELIGEQQNESILHSYYINNFRAYISNCLRPCGGLMQAACLVNELEHKYQYETTVHGKEIYVCINCGHELEEALDGIL